MTAPSPIAIPSAPPGFRAWLVVGLLAVVASLNYLDRVILTTMRGSIVEAIPMTDAQFGLLTSAFLWVYAVMSPIGGFLADKISRTKVILGSLFLWSAVTWLTAHATTFNELLLTRLLMGFGEACYIPAALALIADYHRGPTRSLATGIHMIGISVGQGLGGLGGLLAERHDWTFPFMLFGGIGIAYSVVLLFSLRDLPRATALPGETTLEPVRFWNTIRTLLRLRSYRIALAYWGLVSIGTWAVLGWLPTLLGERFALSQGAAGLSATGYLQPAAWIGLIIGGLWSDRASRTNPRGRLYVTMVGLGLAAPAIFLGANSHVLWAAIAGFMLWSFGLAFVNANMMPILCLIADERQRATGYGVLNLCSTSIGGVTIYLGGALRDAHIPVTVIFNASVVILIVCIGLLSLIKLPPALPARL